MNSGGENEFSQQQGGPGSGRFARRSSSARRRRVLTARRNPWLQHVKKFRASHPKLSYKRVLKAAKKTYRKRSSRKARR
jgi:hypothetical protein